MYAEKTLNRAHVGQPLSEGGDREKVRAPKQPPLMSCEAIRKAACGIKDLGSLAERKASVRQLHDEILRYGHYTEPELEPAILLNIWGTWVKDGVATPDADLFVSCFEALAYAEYGASIPGNDWNNWLQNPSNLGNVAHRILRSEYEDERCEMLRAVISVVKSVEGLAALLDAIDRFDDLNEAQILYTKVGEAFDLLAMKDPGAVNRSDVKRRVDDVRQSLHVHKEVERVINEGVQLSKIRIRSAKNVQNEGAVGGVASKSLRNESSEAIWKRVRQERAETHYDFRLKNYVVALNKTLRLVCSAPVEQAAAAFARLQRTLHGKEPIHKNAWSSFLEDYLSKNLPSAKERFTRLIGF